MKCGLLVCVLFLWVLQVGEGSEVLRIVEQLTNDIEQSVNLGDSWLTRYQQLAATMQDTSDVSTELLGQADMAMPVVWNLFAGNMMMFTLNKIAKGGVGSPWVPSPIPLPPKQPEFLFIYPSNLTCDDVFTVQATVMTTDEVNLGFRVHFAPPEGEPVDYDNGDIFFSFHLRWHFDYGPSREIAFNDRYNGTWSRPEVTVGGNLWPNVKPGERFIISTAKQGPCFLTFVTLGDDMHLNKPVQMPPLVFCPKKQVTGDKRKLWLTVNEDKRGENKVVVQWLTWFPGTA